MAAEQTLEIEQVRGSGAWLIEMGSEEEMRWLELRPGESVVLGSGPLADLRVSDCTVSSRHVRLSAGSGGLELLDLGSTNGVYVGAARVERACMSARSGHFVVGRTSVSVVRGGDRAEPSSGSDVAIPGLVGQCSAMRRLTRQIRQWAPVRAPVLIQGESGSGKDVVARALHDLSGRSGAYVPLNVGGLSETLADSELFGHRKGAFTGAVDGRIGMFQMAHGGTLFLDEVADLAPAVQVKLLRVVEDRAVRPLGGEQPMVVDVRVISASWASLEERVARELFRVDLYHRLSTLLLQVPPLRERQSDLPALCSALLRRQQADIGPRRLTGAALARLAEHRWPGNVRELASVLYRAALAAPGSIIDVPHLSAVGFGVSASPMAGSRRDLDFAVALREHGGNVTAAARSVGVPRTTFRAWLRRHGRHRDAAGES